MKIFLQLASCFLALQATTLADPNLMKWQEFKAKFGKTYKTQEEEEFRMKVFMEKRTSIAEHNAQYERGEVTYKMGINKFSDMPYDEFVNFYTGFNYPKTETPDIRTGGTTVNFPDDISVPDYVNWLEKGAVTPVKNQKQCGSCYAFSATGAIEGQHFLVNRTLVSLSEQNIIDCADNAGCNGGFIIPAFEYVIKNKGIDMEDSYPYEAQRGSCRFNNKTIGATISGYVQLPVDNETALEIAVATAGPVSVAIFGDHNFINYNYGIYSDACCSNKRLNHAVLVVGYGVDPVTLQQYWLVKNSWGEYWGYHGYVQIARNAGNMCGIATYASYPIV